MAGFIKRQSHVLALKLTYRYWLKPADVSFDLERWVGERGREHDVLRKTWRVPAEMLGVVDDVDGREELPLSIPPKILDQLVRAIERAANDDEALWLHLVKPYGCLGALDWEGVLGARLDRRILRIPDFIEDARDPGHVLNVALLCDLPADEPRFRIDDAVAAMTSWAKTAPLTTKYWVFTSHKWRAAVLDGLKDIPGQWVAPEPPPESDPTPSAEGPPRSESWFGWMERSLAHAGLDAIQVLAAAWFTNQTPTLALTRGPCVKQAEDTALYVSPREFAAFLNRTGAWASMFAIAPGALATPMRGFADALAQERPGPVLCHDLSDSRWLETLKYWSKVFFDRRRTPMPKHGGAGFAYCQPSLLAGVEAPVLTSISANLPMLEAFTRSATSDPDRWVANSLRFGELSSLRGRDWSSAALDGPTPSGSLKDEYARTLSQIDEIAAHYATLRRQD